VISNLNGVHVPLSKARVGMKAVATLKYRPAAEQLLYLAHTVEKRMFSDIVICRRVFKIAESD
jgi:hypothetical protein